MGEKVAGPFAHRISQSNFEAADARAETRIDDFSPLLVLLLSLVSMLIQVSAVNYRLRAIV